MATDSGASGKTEGISEEQIGALDRETEATYENMTACSLNADSILT